MPLTIYHGREMSTISGNVFLLFKLTLPADANISLGGLTSDAFEVRSGVKQGIVLAPTLGISRDLLGHSCTTIHSST